MPNYDFLNLAPPEFEDLSRDLLQRQLGVTLESFTAGPDGGIDFRHMEDGFLTVVQCKRYKDFKTTFNALKEELPKVIVLSPNRYIVTVAVGLTPNQKSQIVSLFYPYIQDVSDVFCRQDLNNLLGLYGDIERNQIKLWLSSVNILERILHSKIQTQTILEKEEIDATVRCYVTNPSFNQALGILNDRKYVIISGIPGIGKTTLARILVYYLLQSGFNEFYYVTHIDDAFKVFNDIAAQIFLFDDFLGRSFVDRHLATNDDRELLRFIRKINGSSNKFFILATREYVLAQAKEQFESLNNNSIELSKCVVDLSQYSRMIRAQILYNHLFFSDLPVGHVEALTTDMHYFDIIDHKNYNPRIIETILQKDEWQDLKKEAFVETFIEYLDKPESVWRRAYENHISDFSRYLLATLMTAGVPILDADLHRLMSTFVSTHGQKYGLKFSDIEFRRSLRELDNTFLKSVRDSNGRIAIDYQNPSIQDFLVHYLADMHDMLRDIIDCSIFYNQFLSVFSYEDSDYSDSWGYMRVSLTAQLRDLIAERIISEFDRLDSSGVSRVTYSNDKRQFGWWKSGKTELDKLYAISNQAYLKNHINVRKLLISRFGDYLKPENYEALENNGWEFVRLLKELYREYPSLDPTQLIADLWASVQTLYGSEHFQKLRDVFPVQYDAFIKQASDLSKIIDLAKEEVSSADDDRLDSVLESLQDAEAAFGIDLSDHVSEIEERISEQSEMSYEPEVNFDGVSEGQSSTSKESERKGIISLFSRFEGRT